MEVLPGRVEKALVSVLDDWRLSLGAGLVGSLCWLWCCELWHSDTLFSSDGTIRECTVLPLTVYLRRALHWLVLHSAADWAQSSVASQGWSVSHILFNCVVQLHEGLRTWFDTLFGLSLKCNFAIMHNKPCILSESLIWGLWKVTRCTIGSTYLQETDCT